MVFFSSKYHIPLLAPFSRRLWRLVMSMVTSQSKELFCYNDFKDFERAIEFVGIEAVTLVLVLEDEYERLITGCIRFKHTR